jgi:hypothetical protein
VSLLAVTHEPADLVFVAVLCVAMTLWIWADHRG